MKVCLRPRRRAAGDARDGGQRVGTEVLTHVPTGNVPNRQEDTLALVVTRAVLVGRAEIAECDRTIDGGYDVGKLDVGRVACEHISAADSALRLDDSCTFQCEQNLFQVGLGEGRSFSDVAHGRRTRFVGVKRQREQGAAGIISTRRHSHAVIVGGGLCR